MKSAVAQSYKVIFVVFVLLISIYKTNAQQVSKPASGQSSSIDRNEPAREVLQVPVENGLNPTAKRAQETPARGGFEQDKPVSIKFERGDKIAVDNRTTGRIRITGWDKDFIEAKATSERGVEAIRYKVADDSSQKKILLKADYASRQETVTPGPEPKPTPTETKPEPSTIVITRPTITKPTVPTKPTIIPGQSRLPGDSDKPEISYELERDSSINDGPPLRGDGRPIEVDLEVSVPRYAEIEVIKVIRSNVEVSGVETPLIIVGDKSTVILKNVGAVEVRNRSGSVQVEKASGLIEVVTTSGQVSVRHAGSDVRVLSISGGVQIECVRGRVNVDSSDGKIVLDNVQGDVDANTSNSTVLFTGAIRDDGRYHLKSMSGAVEMVVQDKPPGFTAALSTYLGVIENSFQLRTKQSSQHEESVNRRIIGSYGNGRAQITLDTFDGKVNLRRMPMSAIKECK
jgi:hypothetical protein